MVRGTQQIGKLTQTCAYANIKWAKKSFFHDELLFEIKYAKTRWIQLYCQRVFAYFIFSIVS